MKKTAFVSLLLLISNIALSQDDLYGRERNEDKKITSSMGGEGFIYKNPMYDCRKFNKILVVTNVRSNKDWEDYILEDFTKNGFNVVGELDLFPPFKKYSEQDVKAICNKNGIDGILSVVQTDKEFSNTTVLGYGFYGSSIWGISNTYRQEKLFLEITMFDPIINENAFVIIGNSLYGGVFDGSNRILRRFTRMVANQASKKKLICK